MGRALFSRVNVYHGTPVHTVGLRHRLHISKILVCVRTKTQPTSKTALIKWSACCECAIYMCGAGGARRAMSDMSYGVK